MSKWQKKLNLYRFDERVPCPYCPKSFPSNVSLCRHVLHVHNWNKDFLKGFEVIETHGSVMIALRKDEKPMQGVHPALQPIRNLDKKGEPQQ